MQKNNQQKLDEERRDVHRRGADLKVSFAIVSLENGRKTKEVPGAVKNLSETGFCLTTDLTIIDDLHVLSSSSGVSKNQLDIKLVLPNDKEIRMDGYACWYNLAEAGSFYRYDVGVRIEKISEEDLSLLRTCLREERKMKLLKSLFGIKWLERLFGGS